MNLDLRWFRGDGGGAVVAMGLSCVPVLAVQGKRERQPAVSKLTRSDRSKK